MTRPAICGTCRYAGRRFGTPPSQRECRQFRRVFAVRDWCSRYKPGPRRYDVETPVAEEVLRIEHGEAAIVVWAGPRMGPHLDTVFEEDTEGWAVAIQTGLYVQVYGELMCGTLTMWRRGDTKAEVVANAWPFLRSIVSKCAQEALAAQYYRADKKMADFLVCAGQFLGVGEP